MARVYFSLGSNQGDRLKSLVEATKQIDRLIGKVVDYSPVVESEPWGFAAETAFYNQVLQVETGFSPQEVLAQLLDIETKSGRVRSGNTYSSRIIDIDILFYEDATIEEGNLVVPHPMLHLRRFVLEPLALIAPDLRHPLLLMTVSELLVQTEDHSLVHVVVDKDEFSRIMNTL